jgi:hypothetical protein
MQIKLMDNLLQYKTQLSLLRDGIRASNFIFFLFVGNTKLYYLIGCSAKFWFVYRTEKGFFLAKTRICPRKCCIAWQEYRRQIREIGKNVSGLGYKKGQ